MGREVLEDSEEDAEEFAAGQPGQAPAHPEREEDKK